MNYKVKVENEVESKKVQGLFESLGYTKISWSYLSCPKLISNHIDGEYSDYPCGDYIIDRYKELTIPQLKDMVVLKRNDTGDATHTDQDNWKWYIGADSYVWQAGNSQELKQWDKASLNNVDLKPIEKKEMKEYLDPTNCYELVITDTPHLKWIEVPKGATYMTQPNRYFWNDNDINYAWDGEAWTDNSGETMQQYLESSRTYTARVVWQRSKQTSIKDKTIDGVEAFNAIANDITVQYRFAGGVWKDYTQDLNHDSSNLKAVDFLCDLCEFRYKPKIIIVNGVEYEDEREATNAVKDYFKGDM